MSDEQLGAIFRSRERYLGASDYAAWFDAGYVRNMNLAFEAEICRDLRDVLDVRRKRQTSMRRVGLA